MKNKKYEPVLTEVEEPVIEETTIPEEPAFEEHKGIVVGCTSLYVRMAPHSNGTPIMTIDAGTIVDVIGEANDFWNVKVSDGTDGYCMKKFIKIV